jgi:fatty-acyl-CoA synthase
VRYDWPCKTTFGKLLDTSAEKWGAYEALVFYGQRFTYSQVKEQVDIVAKGLIDIGVKKGDKVSIWLNNCPEWAFLFFAAAKVGAAIIPINTRFKSKELSYVLGQSDSSFLIIGRPFLSVNYFEILKEIIPEVITAGNGEINSNQYPLLKRIISVGCDYEGTTNYEELKIRGENTADSILFEREAQVDPDDLFNIIYTSGTSGFPKGVMHSHKIIANMRNAANRLEMTEKDRLLLFLPLFHVYGSLLGVTAAFLKGACVVLMDSFDPGKSLRLIDEEKITLLYGLDTMYFDMINHQNYHKYSRDSLRLTICASPPFITKEILEKKLCRRLVNAYGMTETTSITSMSFVDDPEEKVISTNGFPLPDFSLKIVDPFTGDELPRNEVGELCIKGHPVMLGYYKNPSETERVIDHEGWFHTSDSAYIDEEGYLKIVGRIKDIIRVGGENVDPIEVESLLCTNPAIYRVSVVAAPDQRLGEVCYAFVQFHEGKTANLTELIDFCRGKIASFKIPRGITVIPEFPMTPTGKIQKFKLREMAKERMNHGVL